MAKYDVALSRWCTDWLRRPTATMPAMVLHGSWDGYTDSLFDLYKQIFQ